MFTHVFRYGIATSKASRPRNDDGYVIHPDRGLFAVIDPVGSRGHPAVAGGALKTFLMAAAEVDGPVEQALERAFAEAKDRMVQRAAGLGSRMGVCATAIRVLPKHGGYAVYVRHAGDTRLVAVDHRVWQITTPHRQEDGAVSCYIGSDSQPDDLGDAHEVMLRAGAWAFLMSDGADSLTEADIGWAIAQCGGDPQIAADLLVQCALQAGAKDNITVLAVRLPE